MASGESAFKKPSGFHKSDIGLFKSNISRLVSFVSGLLFCARKRRFFVAKFVLDDNQLHSGSKQS